MLVAMVALFLSYLPFSTSCDWFFTPAGLVQPCHMSESLRYTSYLYPTVLPLILCSSLKSAHIQKQIASEIMQNVSICVWLGFNVWRMDGGKQSQAATAEQQPQRARSMAHLTKQLVAHNSPDPAMYSKVALMTCNLDPTESWKQGLFIFKKQRLVFVMFFLYNRNTFR